MRHPPSSAKIRLSDADFCRVASKRTRACIFRVELDESEDTKKLTLTNKKIGNVLRFDAEDNTFALQPTIVTNIKGLGAISLDVTQITIGDVKKLRLHSASFRSVSSWLSIKRSVASLSRALRLALTGRMMSASPSVVTSSLVSLSMLSRSRIGRSMISPRLFPMVQSVFSMIAPPYQHRSNNSITVVVCRVKVEAA